MIDFQYLTHTSRLDCAQMPVVPDEWYAVVMFYPDNMVREVISTAKGYNINRLYAILDSIKSTNSLRVFIWIERQ